MNSHSTAQAKPENFRVPMKSLANNRFAECINSNGFVYIFDKNCGSQECSWNLCDEQGKMSYVVREIVGETSGGLLLHADDHVLFLDKRQGQRCVLNERFVKVSMLSDGSFISISARPAMVGFTFNEATEQLDRENLNLIVHLNFHKIDLAKGEIITDKSRCKTLPGTMNLDNSFMLDNDILIFQDEHQAKVLDLKQGNAEAKTLWTHPTTNPSVLISFEFEWDGMRGLKIDAKDAQVYCQQSVIESVLNGKVQVETSLATSPARLWSQSQASSNAVVTKPADAKQTFNFKR